MQVQPPVSSANHRLSDLGLALPARAPGTSLEPEPENLTSSPGDTETLDSGDPRLLHLQNSEENSTFYLGSERIFHSAQVHTIHPSIQIINTWLQ